MQMGQPATLQPRRSSASSFDPVPRSMPFPLSITRSPIPVRPLFLPVSQSQESPRLPVVKVQIAAAPRTREKGYVDAAAAPLHERRRRAKRGRRKPRCIAGSSLPSFLPSSSAQKRGGSMPTIHSGPLFKSFAPLSLLGSGRYFPILRLW